MYVIKTPQFIQSSFPGYVWRIPSAEPTLYLTFDDGPIPGVTPWVLDILQQYQAKATFFCVGDNVRKHPAIYHRIVAEGHAVGNHTYNHLNGWKTDARVYIHNVRHCLRLVPSKLFRPPYGRIMPRQRAFLQRHFRIVMWDVLSGDFDPKITARQCLENVLKNAESGSIVVLHDSLKAEPHLRVVLPEVLEYYAKAGYVFRAIPDAG